MMQTLEQLSAAATEAMEKAMRLIDAGARRDVIAKASFENTVAHEKLAHALVNAYRTGQLVEVQADDAIERVARAILKAHAFDTTGVTEDAANAIADHAVQAWIPEAKAAIGAMKGPKP